MKSSPGVMRASLVAAIEPPNKNANTQCHEKPPHITGVVMGGAFNAMAFMGLRRER